jgi:hypothetical protein
MHSFRGILRHLGYVLSGSVADPDQGSGAFLPSGSGIRDEFFPDPRSRLQRVGTFFGEIFLNYPKNPFFFNFFY